MKRFLLSFVAVVGLLATSCVQDATNDMELNKQGVVTFAVDAQHTSRAYGVAAEANDLYYAVYQNGTLLNEISVLPGEEPVTLVNGAANVSIPLATGLEYEFIFWAASPAAISEELYWLDWDAKTMTLNPDKLVTSDESLDAFYYRGTFEVSGTATRTITLKRPFAQINVATGDTEKAENAGLTVAQTWFEVSGAFKTLNLATGFAEGSPVTLNYKAAAKPADEQIRANNKDYDLLGVIYVLANKDESPLNNVKFSYNRNAGEAAVKSVEVPSAPIKRNARTNLVGNILTSNNGFDVDIDEGFEDTFTLEDALANQISNGGVVTLTSDIVLNNNVTGFVISKDTEIDLAGNSITIPDTDASRAASSAKASIFTVEGDVNFTIKNGTIVIPSTNGNLNGTNASTGAGNAIIFDSTGKLVVENVTIEASKRGGWRAIEVYAGEAEINNSTINCYHGSGVNSSNAKVTLNNCDITVNGMYSAPYNSVCFSCMYGGELTVNGGNYKIINTADYATGDTHGGWLGIVMSSGGTLILNDGTFENVPADGFNPAYERAIIEAENNAPAVSTVVFAGGKYKPQHSKVYGGYGDKYYPTWVNEEKLTLGEDGWYTVADNKGYVVNGDEYLVSTGAGLAAAVVDAPANAKITLTDDVDLTDVDYTPRSFTSLVFNGNYHTISGVKVEGVDQAALFGKTWKFDIQNVTLANSTFVANNVDGEDAAAGFIGFLQTYSAGSKLVNCHVENSTFGVAKYVGGLIAYKDGTYPIALENCSVKNSTLISKYSEDGGAKYKGHCGGLVGYFCGEATSTITNGVVEGNTFDVLGARCGLFIGSAQNDYAVSGKVENNTGLLMLCGEVNKITDWSNVEYNFHASNAAELKAGIAANFKTIYIKGQIDLTEEILAGYNGTIIGADEAACLNTRTFTVIAADEAYHLSDKTINFKNITIKVPTEDGDFLKTGFVAAGTMNFDNCVFEGQVTLNGHATWTFNECEFGGADNGAYASFVYGATKATFNDCSFSGVDRAAKIYGTGGVLNVEYNNCTFTSTTSNKYAVNIDASYATTNVALNDCSQTGMPGLFAVTGSKASITVNGAEYVGNGLYKSGSKYSVENAEGLALLNSKLVEMSVGRNVAIELLANIDFTGKTWTPVKSHIDWNNTVNSINGNGYTISNLTINGQAMFTIFSNGADVVVKDVTFENATVNNTNGINSAIIVGQTYSNLLLDNVDVKSSTITGKYKVAPLIGTVYNEGASTITATLKNCDVENTTVKSTQHDYFTTGLVSFVYTGDNDKIEFENCTVSNVRLYAPNSYTLHAAIYAAGEDALFNEAEGVTVTNVTFENI